MSYVSLNYHIVFSTKERRPFLHAEIMSELVPYLGGAIGDLGGTMLKANGPHDHIHIVTMLSPTLAVADCMRSIKANSSKWIHQKFLKLRDFAWQDGYAAFAVSRSVLPSVLDYVTTQDERHRKMSFSEELMALLEKHNVSYDERHLT